MSFRSDATLATAIMPLPNPSPVQHNWAVMGLPEYGWVLIKDRVLCLDGCSGSEVCVDACITSHELPADKRQALGTCAQCDPAPCATVCPTDAITHNAQGIVQIDQEFCVGCRFCEDECDNHALMYVDPFRKAPPANPLKHYSPGQPTGLLPSTVAKCTLCSDRLLTGLMPICADACPKDAIWVGNLDRDTATNGRQLIRLSTLLGQKPFTLVGPGNRMIHLT